MTWIKIGRREESIFEKSIKITAWSKVLNKELCSGYSEFIVTKIGDQFVKTSDEDRIISNHKVSNQLNSFIKYSQKTTNADKVIAKLLFQKKVDFEQILNVQLLQLANFLITRMIADNLYEDSRLDLKLKIERWRNSKSLFNSQSKVLKSLSTHTNIPTKILEHMTLDEVRNALKTKKVDIDNIKKRFNKNWSLVLMNDQLKIFLEDLTPIHNFNSSDILKGRVAFGTKNKIQGVVGKDILVEIMTTPSMVSEMKQMKAVITDEGGVLCHAAIAAREFRIPTIVGTKIATQILKKGDPIEVDTTDGTVKKLS